MTADLVLTILHHLFAFSLAAVLVAELVALRPGLAGIELSRLALLDAAYGASAGGVLVVGILRLIYGARGYEYFLANPWFWAKMAAFAAVGILSIAPTLKLLAWRRKVAADPAFAPATDEVAALRRYLHGEAALVVLVIVFAATMVRFT